eukprot:2360145-Rhodomonas_salina.2
MVQATAVCEGRRTRPKRLGAASTTLVRDGHRTINAQDGTGNATIRNCIWGEPPGRRPWSTTTRYVSISSSSKVRQLTTLCKWYRAAASQGSSPVAVLPACAASKGRGSERNRAMP